MSWQNRGHRSVQVQVEHGVKNVDEGPSNVVTLNKLWAVYIELGHVYKVIMQSVAASPSCYFKSFLPPNNARQICLMRNLKSASGYVTHRI